MSYLSRFVGGSSDKVCPIGGELNVPDLAIEFMGLHGVHDITTLIDETQVRIANSLQRKAGRSSRNIPSSHIGLHCRLRDRQ